MTRKDPPPSPEEGGSPEDLGKPAPLRLVQPGHASSSAALTLASRRGGLPAAEGLVSGTIFDGRSSLRSKPPATRPPSPILRGGNDELLASEVASQIDLHRVYGGVVPEAASRQHLRELPLLLDHTLKRAGIELPQVDAFAATAGPGLASSLMIGAAVAKGLAVGTGKPYLGINHLEGHLLSPFFGRAGGIEPAVGLIVSGGHTLLIDIAGFRQYRRLGGTLDDAAGEAFDKVGKLVGLPYPGGPQIDQLARDGDPARFDLPRSMLHSGDSSFSFSGLKTAVRYLLPKLGLETLSGDERRQRLADVCASFQEAVVAVLVRKTLAAVRKAGRRLVGSAAG